MLGIMLKQLFLDSADEEDVSASYASAREIWEKLDEAACIFTRELPLLHGEETITTVASRQSYDLPGGFINLYLQNRRSQFILKYYDGSNYSFPVLAPYEQIYRENTTDEQTWPNKFAIRDKEDKETLVTGTATAAGAETNGQCTLTDATKLFTTTNRVWPRDIIYNSSQSSMGYVLSVTDATHLVVALFDADGAADSITLGDSYIIQPASKQQLYFDAPSESAGHIIYVPYLCLPDPVYSDLGMWRFSPETCKAIVSGATALFKTPKKEYKEASQLGSLFAQELSRKRKEVGMQKLRSRGTRNAMWPA